MSETPRISLVVPAYQEEKRIGRTLAVFSEYLAGHHPGSELIVVCDGCTDATAAVARKALETAAIDHRVMELPVNQGKGGAVKTGILAAAGDYLLFTDADLSYAPEIMEEFIARLDDGADLAIAQRQKKTTYPGLGRRLLALGSRFLVGNLILPGIRDTQAGFKAFKRQAGRELFGLQRTTRFLFDLEILMLARHKGLRIDKVYVDWQDQEGSTVRIFVDSLRSLRDLILIKLWILTGAYDRAINGGKGDPGSP